MATPVAEITYESLDCNPGSKRRPRPFWGVPPAHNPLSRAYASDGTTGGWSSRSSCDPSHGMIDMPTDPCDWLGSGYCKITLSKLYMFIYVVLFFYYFTPIIKLSPGASEQAGGAMAFDSQVFWAFLSALSLSISSMSCKQQAQCFKKSRSRLQCMDFVTVSDSCAALWTQWGLIPDCKWSLMTKASIRVRWSWIWGVVFLEITSNRDLQSSTAMLGGAFFHTVSGFFHGVWAFLIYFHAKRIQSSKSTAVDRAKVSAARVLATTLSIFFENQTNGLARALCCWKTFSWVAKMIPPFWLCFFSRVANDASEYETNLTWLTGMLEMVTVTSACFLVSPNRRLASSRSCMVAQLIFDWRKLSFAETSGRVLIAAYWSEPMRPLRPWRSLSLMVSCSFLRRCRSMVIGSIPRIYLFRSRWKFHCWSCRMWIPVNVKSVSRLAPNGNFFSSWSITLSKNSSPQQRPSSTWIPSKRCTVPSVSRRENKHGSRGLMIKFNLINSSLSSWYHK